MLTVATPCATGIWGKCQMALLPPHRPLACPKTVLPQPLSHPRSVTPQLKLPPRRPLRCPSSVSPWWGTHKQLPRWLLDWTWPVWRGLCVHWTSARDSSSSQEWVSTRAVNSLEWLERKDDTVYYLHHLFPQAIQFQTAGWKKSLKQYCGWNMNPCITKK